MQQWEYCRIQLEKDALPGQDQWVIITFGDSGVDFNTQRYEVGGDLEMLGKLIARLGREGWEMVSVTDGGLHYFKRPAS